ncbi:MAG TPA: cytosine permease [Vicinamibacterales bacterium]|nr:cytosine permease [Vicinamibacterales bacterium]
MDAADLAPVPESERTQPAFDLFLIFAAANVVATTLQTGAVLGARYGSTDVLVLVVAGACFGAMLVALLAPVGSRSGVPSMIAARAPLGFRGAQVVSGLLYLTNFAWIAVNNTIAASVCAQMLGGPETSRLWAAALGLLATAVVARGPRAVGYADRIAVPIMIIAGAFLTYSAFAPQNPPLEPLEPVAPLEPVPLLWGLDVVIGYQVSWLLMFADYSRYTRSARASATAVFAGLALPALWLMPVGWTLARIAGSDDPGTMLAAAANTGWWTPLLVALATVTTNFVNIYLSSLAWRTLSHRSTGAGTVWTIGIIGTLLGLVSSVWLTRFAELMMWLGAILVPVGGVFLAHFLVLRERVNVDAIYRRDKLPAFTVAGMLAWALGFVVYKLATPIGATLPALAASMLVYVALRKLPFASTRPSD